MAAAKWFLKLSALTPPLDAARVVLESRARVVSHYLQSLANRRNEHPEQIHQLRVATRRFGAALAIFRDLLRPDDYRTIRRLARRARRSAAAARDLDVHRELSSVRIGSTSAAARALDSLCDNALTKQRILAYEHLIKVTRAAASDFNKAVQRGLAHLSDQQADRKRRAHTGNKNLGRMARKTLRKRLQMLRRDARKNLLDWQKLHRLRIAAKRLRYAMEVFAGCFPLGFRRQLYRVVERIQEDIGHVNDLRNLARSLKKVRNQCRSDGSTSKSSLKSLEQFRKRVLGEARMSRQRFIKRWNSKAQKSFHRRVKNVLNRPMVRSRVRSVQLSKL